MATLDVAVTGATGLIGRALVTSLAADGHRVRQLVRPGTEPLPGTVPVTWDPAAGSIDAGGLEGLDAAVHLAGAGIGDSRWSEDRKRTILESRTTSTRLLSEALAACATPPAVMVSGSAIGYYGDCGDRVLTEASPPGDIFLSEVVRQWEAAAHPAVDAGIRVPFLRTAVVLSPTGGTLRRLLPLFRLGLGGRFGSGRQWWSWITIDDVVDVIRWLIDGDVAGPVNAAAPQPLPNRDFTKVLAGVLHRPAFLPVPTFGPKLVFGSELVDQLIMLSQRVEPAVLADAGFTFRHPTLDGALRSLLGR